jgi:hypothetical protein
MKKPQPDLRKTLTALVRQAAGGRADLAWLDRAIRKAGYAASAEATTRKDLGAARAAIVQALVDAETTAETPCCRECLHRAIDALTLLAAGR